MKDNKIITPQKFLEELRRYQKGSVTPPAFSRRDRSWAWRPPCSASAMPGLKPRKAYAALSGTVNLTTWPNYHNQENLDAFTKNTGVTVNMNVFGSNEEMLAKLQAGSTGWDVFVPTNYTITTYKGLDLIEPLDLKLLPNYDASTQDRASPRKARSTARSMRCRRTGAPPAL